MGYESYTFYLRSRVREVFGVFFGRLMFSQRPEWTSLNGKTAIVTGSNVGIGLEAARGLAERGATVILACRSPSKAEVAKRDIVDKSGGKVKEEQIEVMPIDLGDLDSVKQFVTTWGTRRLDILINNAGRTIGKYTHSPQGFEMTYNTNILSHYLLTLSLLPYIHQNGRIINVSSDMQYQSKQIDPLDLDYSKAIEKDGVKLGDAMSPSLSMALYSRSKLLQVLFTRELQQRLETNSTYKTKDITVHAYHPGEPTQTGLVRSSLVHRPDGTILNSKIIIALVHGFFHVLGVSTTQGAATGIHLAASSKAAVNPGHYWYRMAIDGPNRLVHDVETRKLLFDQLANESGLGEELKV
ncbi:hypothetical protein DL96DRAFT_1736475 [Flagelloscypha sp. PMI_526]|nr:hypothetical protein DL96DRAFT_1736475 [Flagelloscypha sp. PMI_526]